MSDARSSSSGIAPPSMIHVLSSSYISARRFHGPARLGVASLNRDVPPKSIPFTISAYLRCRLRSDEMMFWPIEPRSMFIRFGAYSSMMVDSQATASSCSSLLRWTTLRILSPRRNATANRSPPEPAGSTPMIRGASGSSISRLRARSTIAGLMKTPSVSDAAKASVTSIGYSCRNLPIDPSSWIFARRHSICPSVSPWIS